MDEATFSQRSNKGMGHGSYDQAAIKLFAQREPPGNEEIVLSDRFSVDGANRADLKCSYITCDDKVRGIAITKFFTLAILA